MATRAKASGADALHRVRVTAVEDDILLLMDLKSILREAGAGLDGRHVWRDRGEASFPGSL